MDWFLYDNSLRHERVKRIYNDKKILVIALSLYNNKVVVDFKENSKFVALINVHLYRKSNAKSLASHL